MRRRGKSLFMTSVASRLLIFFMVLFFLEGEPLLPFFDGSLRSSSASSSSPSSLLFLLRERLLPFFGGT